MSGGRLALLLFSGLALVAAAVMLVRTDGAMPPGPEVEVAQDSCTANCNAQWNRCRISTKGANSCDAQRAACMQACLPRKK